MKVLFFCLLALTIVNPLTAQDVLSQYKLDQPLTPEVATDLIKIVWDETKLLAEEYVSEKKSKSEFETTSAFQARLQRTREKFIAKIRKFSNETKFNTRVMSIIFKAELAQYDADKETYSIKSTQVVNVPPSKEDMKVMCIENNFIAVSGKNELGYRRALLGLKMKPDFTWYVNNQVAQTAKQKEANLFFRLWFKFAIDVTNPDFMIIQIVPAKISLVDQVENFTYWTEEIQ
jgi:hypothetical protein